MIITISGTPGSGKSVVSKKLIQKLNYKEFSIGDIAKNLAREKGITINELNKLAETDPSIDNYLDSHFTELAKSNENYVVVSRIAFNFIPNSFKIFLYVKPEIAAERIKKDNRKEENYITIEEFKEKVLQRIQSEETRYKHKYNINIYDKTNYDLWLDTGNLTVDEVVNTIIKEYNHWLNKKVKNN